MAAARALAAPHHGLAKQAVCQICSQIYAPTSSRQKWCQACIPGKQARSRYQRYGLTEAAWQALIAPWRGFCRLCMEREALFVDHDHVTGRVRGGLCNKCNSGLHFMENAEWFARAIEYLSEGGQDGSQEAAQDHQQGAAIVPICE